MSNYIYTNDGLVNADELTHYGVPGMRWGHKKAGYVTGFQAKKRATIAANEARKKSIAESRASGDKGIGSFQRANRKALNAKRKAYGESMKADMDHNKKLRDEKRAVKNTTVGKRVTKGVLTSIGIHAVSEAVNFCADKVYGKGSIPALTTRILSDGGAIAIDVINIKNTVKDSIEIGKQQNSKKR